ncbi:hypothetical protein AAP_02656 [Ascosphaera apis ARSEF 7405]|uniref:Transmembrane protein n=1 Tax=Ascosphaera apis ARSEF 7405 TaxID=392613 RepID=A0A166NY53_9EURO|nr:hypothetical protein AAP_02656 [Ascosphaera apis ARSEF 7405]
MPHPPCALDEVWAGYRRPLTRRTLSQFQHEQSSDMGDTFVRISIYPGSQTSSSEESSDNHTNSSTSRKSSLSAVGEVVPEDRSVGSPEPPLSVISEEDGINLPQEDVVDTPWYRSVWIIVPVMLTILFAVWIFHSDEEVLKEWAGVYIMAMLIISNYLLKNGWGNGRVDEIYAVLLKWFFRLIVFVIYLAAALLFAVVVCLCLFPQRPTPPKIPERDLSEVSMFFTQSLYHAVRGSVVLAVSAVQNSWQRSFFARYE